MAEDHQHFDQRDPRIYEQRLAGSRLGPEWSQGEWREVEVGWMRWGQMRGRCEADAKLIGGYPDDSARREALFPNRGIRGAEGGEYEVY